jgi:hypothetical protein
MSWFCLLLVKKILDRFIYKVGRKRFLLLPRRNDILFGVNNYVFNC